MRVVASSATRTRFRVAAVGNPLPAHLRVLLGQAPGFGLPEVYTHARRARGVEADLVVLCTGRPADDLREFDPSRTASGPPVLLIASTVDTDAAIEAIALGATSYLIDGEFTRGDLINALVSTTRGESSVSPAVTTALVHRCQIAAPTASTAQTAVPLTRRDRDLLDLLAEGHNNLRIAEELFLSEKTVRNYISRLYTKLEVSSRAEAIVWWMHRRAV